MYNLIIRPLLFCIDPEKVHRMLLSWLKFYRYLFPVRACVRGYSRVSDPFSYGHLQFKNRIGLSAGFDKNAEAFDELADFGFGFLEVGTVTPDSQSGNPSPRIFRLVDDESLISRTGFNNCGVDAVRQHIRKYRKHSYVLGVNINKNPLSTGDQIIKDFESTFIHLYDCVDYFTLNWGSIDSDLFAMVLEKLTIFRQAANKRCNIFIKLPADVDEKALDTVISLAYNAALNFYNQNRVSYRYILEGYEKEWHYNGKNRIASYTNVPPGDYTFRVETVDEANPELVSNCTLAITILPPWWLSWWATLIYVILGLAALYFSLRLAFFMLKMKNDIYIEQKVSEMKIKFFTNISHELRTPLTLIKGPIQELREREKLSPKGLQYVDLMEKNTNQMLQLVNQILDFRKIQNGKMRLHVSLIDFNEMIASFQKEFRVLSEENEISFTFQLPDEPIMVWADKEKMSIVIRNIISNAFKFTHSGGSIYITTGLTDDGKRCYVRVEDNGVGIPQNKLTEIFERFSQGENAKNSYYQGTGIGLALSKEIVNLHHGQIRAESPEGQGAVFIVELLMDKEHYRPSEVDFYVGDTETAPVSVEQDPVANAISEDGTEEEPEIDASLPTLLLVEDNKDLCQLIKLQLEDKFNIHIANNGVEGLKKVHLYHPDIVVTDQMMPEMDGLEMLQSIRKDFQISHIPVIILTAKNDEGAKTKAITLGANAYITKPFSKEYLLARIDQLLAERKLFRERIRQQMENQTTTEEDSYEQFLVKKDVQFLEKIHQVIEENMDDSDFNIDTIASGIGLSRSAFFKKLKSLTGLAPVDLVKEIRLNKSIELIKNTDLSVSEIAFAVGFKDSGYYSKCFRKKYNQSPREYMNEWRKGER